MSRLIASRSTSTAARRPRPAGPVGHAVLSLDLRPPAATMTELPARHVTVDRVAVQLQAGRQPLEHAGKARAVRLPGGDHAQQRHRLLSLVFASAGDWA